MTIDKQDKLSYNVTSLLTSWNCPEILTLTYGSFVTQLISDLPDIEAVNEKLYKSLIEDFLSKNGEMNCNDFRETADIISKLYLGITPTVTNWSQDNSEFSLVFENNPLAESVELPPEMETLWYSNILPGIIKGALEMMPPSSKTSCGETDTVK
ncbi:hypothetical protein RF11_14416 [Thelohanellus kitauei]|uniref:Uncharacterized protein n=1 Tax=Thelohanellus kitauei TaxID=669202 RepID=A0A0C2MLL9_THEKT|nr:hypothetical protein RF11_14416 [Thelohanellus kitauei]